MTCAFCGKGFLGDYVTIRTLPCGHTFHHDCVLEWSKTRRDCITCGATFVAVPDTVAQLLREYSGALGMFIGPTRKSRGTRQLRWAVVELALDIEQMGVSYSQVIPLLKTMTATEAMHVMLDRLRDAIRWPWRALRADFEPPRKYKYARQYLKNIDDCSVTTRVARRVIGGADWLVAAVLMI